MFTKILTKIREWWASLPATVRVMIYSGMSVFLSTLTVDLTNIDKMWAKYALIGIAVIYNIIGYLILREKES